MNIKRDANNKLFFSMSILVFFAAFLSVYSTIPYFRNIREVYSPSASIPFFFVMLIDQVYPHQGFVIPLYKKVIMFFGGGFIGFVISFVWLKLFFNSEKLSIAYIFLFVFCVISSMFYFYSLLDFIHIDPFFYFYVFSLNILFAMLCMIFYFKSLVTKSISLCCYLHVTIFVWLMWCAFPYYMNVVTI